MRFSTSAAAAAAAATCASVGAATATAGASPRATRAASDVPAMRRAARTSGERLPLSMHRRSTASGAALSAPHPMGGDVTSG